MSAPLVHGVRTLEEQRRSGTLTEETERAIGDALRSFADDRGGLERCNNTEVSLMRDMAVCDLIVGRVLAEADRRKTIFTDDGALLPVFKALATYMNTKRLHALAIGIRPDRPDPTGTACARCSETFASAQAYLGHRCTASAATAVDAPEAGERSGALTPSSPASIPQSESDAAEGAALRQEQA